MTITCVTDSLYRSAIWLAHSFGLLLVGNPMHMHFHFCVAIETVYTKYNPGMHDSKQQGIRI